MNSSDAVLPSGEGVRNGESERPGLAKSSPASAAFSSSVCGQSQFYCYYYYFSPPAPRTMYSQLCLLKMRKSHFAQPRKLYRKLVVWPRRLTAIPPSVRNLGNAHSTRESLVVTGSLRSSRFPRMCLCHDHVIPRRKCSTILLRFSTIFPAIAKSFLV